MGAAAPPKEGFPPSLRGKRVLLATESLGPVNGVSRTTGMLIDCLRDNGVQVAVVAPNFEGHSPPQQEVQVRLRGYPLPYNPDLTVVYPFRIDRLRKRTFAPDIVYLASPASVGFQFLLQLRQLPDPPAVICNFQTDLSSYSNIIFSGGLDHYAVWLLQMVQGFLFSHWSVNTIFYPSAGIRSYLENAGVPSSKLVRLGRGVDTAMFNPTYRDEAYRRELAPQQEIILVCVCRLAPEKGFEFLAQVAERLDIPFKLLIVGGNRNPSVEREVRELFEHTKTNVVFTGFLTGKALARAYATADIFLHCSITETFGLVVLEAMASGLPVVARDQGGPSEIVRDQKTGFLIQPLDQDEFVNCVERLSKDKELRMAQATAARKVAEDTTWEKINHRAAHYLADALETRPSSSSRRNPKWHHDLKKRILSQFIIFRLQAAIALVCVFWIIAVVPLLLNGNDVLGRMRRVFKAALSCQIPKCL